MNVGPGVARQHREQHRFADAGTGEDAHALAEAAGQEGVERAHAEIERPADPAARMRRRRVVAEGEELLALRQGRAAIDGAAERIDDAAEPGRGRPDAGRGLVDIGRAAAAHAVEPAIGHDQRLLAGKADDLAGDAAARRDLDLDAAAQAHRADGPRDLDQKPAHRDHAAIDRHGVEAGDRRGEAGKAIMAMRGAVHNCFRKPFIYPSD